jgi:aryl-phospho-beta-D-glucosidase BglC (GH1 family)
MSGFANLYKEGTELNTAYMNYWNNVAEFFKDNKFILGYDLINEPPTANVYKALWLLRLSDK